MNTTSIIVAGVGGQGSILAAHILGKAALRQAQAEGKPVQVRIGETYGAAMRGGKVFSHVRIGDAYAPLTKADGAVLLIGLEPLETLRVAIPYLSPTGACVVNTAKYVPVDVKMGRVEYPDMETILAGLKGLGQGFIALDATAAAKELGKPAVMNIIMLGAACATGALPLQESFITATIAEEVPKGTAELNLRAFQQGRAMAINLAGTGAV